MTVPLHFRNHVYKIKPDMQLVADIESEMGGVENLLLCFSGGAWKVTDLVSVVHMMLQAAGKTTDYMALGDQMLEDGLDKYLPQAQKLLKSIVKK